MFFSSHILSDIEVMCDRAAIIVGGRLRGQGTLNELIGQTVKSVDCAFLYEGPLPGTLIRRDGTRVEVRVTPEEVDSLIDHVRAEGGKVLSIHPSQKNLEAVLLDEIERARPIQAARLGVLS